MLKGIAASGASAASGITVGTSIITGGTNTRVLFDDNGVIGESAGLTYVKASGLLAATAMAIGGAAIGSNALAVAGPSALTGQVTNALGAITTSQPFTLTQTWNAGGVTFTGMVINVTDTASSGGSSPLRIQFAGSDFISFGKPGGGGLTIGNATSSGSFNLTNAGGATTVQASGATGSGMSVSSGGTFSWDSSTVITGSPDLLLRRDAANTLAQRNGANAQASRYYFSFTDASNYTRFAINTASAVMALAAESAGTGTANVDVAIVPKGTGNVSFPGGVLLKTTAALTDGAAAALGTLTNSPTAGNPTKWVPINDNGTTRYVPAW